MPKRPKQTELDSLISDPVVQLILRADGIDEAEFRELLRQVGWNLARSRQSAEHPATTVDGAEAINDYRLGVGIMLLDKDNRVFVACRNDTETEAWQMPQGGIEPGEDPLHAAMRELKEEIGTDNVAVLAESRGFHQYDLPHELLGKTWHGRWRGQRQKWFVMRFLGQDSDIAVETVASPEFSAWKWVSSAELPSAVAEFKRQLYVDLLAEFRSYHTAPTSVRDIR